MRNIIEVIDQVKAIMPEGGRLIGWLDNVVDSVRYTAPEAMVLRWQDFQTQLVDRFSDELESDLAIKARNIFNHTDKPV